jgi:hypothetical protein
MSIAVRIPGAWVAFKSVGADFLHNLLPVVEPEGVSQLIGWLIDVNTWLESLPDGLFRG